MERLNRIFAEWAKDEKRTELASEKIELNAVKDFDSSFNKFYKTYDMDVLNLAVKNAIDKLRKNYQDSAGSLSIVDKNYQELRKAAMDLGVDAPPKQGQMYKEVLRFMKEGSAIVKKYR